jgi:hypothetical protein
VLRAARLAPASSAAARILTAFPAFMRPSYLQSILAG